MKKVPLIQWDDVERETVDRLPVGIDGTKVYVIDGFTTKKRNALKLLNDGRRWKKNCPTNWQGHKRVRYADCKGSSICENENCPFKLQYGIINRTQFEKRSRDEKRIPRLSAKDAEVFQNLFAALLVGISAMERNL